MNGTVIYLEESSSEILIPYGLGNTSFTNETGNTNHGHQYQFYMVSPFFLIFIMYYSGSFDHCHDPILIVNGR